MDVVDTSRSESLRSRSTAGVVALGAAVAAVMFVATPAQAATTYSISGVTVTPVLANDPYAPLVDGTDEHGDGDAGDCTISGVEVYEASATMAAGCGGVDVAVAITKHGDELFDHVGGTVTLTRTFVCTSDRTHKQRRRSTATSTTGFALSVGEYFLHDDATTHRLMHAVAPLTQLRCNKHEKATMLALTVSDLTIQVVRDDGNGGRTIAASFPQTGTWTVAR